jgi:hypothetical protein
VEGVREVEFEFCVHRVGICFEPSRVTISTLLGTLAPFGLNPRVVSVVRPCLHDDGPYS